MNEDNSVPPGQKDDLSVDAIIEGVHGYMPDNYVAPKEPEVRERLEWLQDQKLALMMHFGLYSQMGVIESWPLSDIDAHWSRVQVDWTDDGERDPVSQIVPVADPRAVAGVRHLGTGMEIPFAATHNGIAIRLPEAFRANPCADGFAIAVDG